MDIRSIEAPDSCWRCLPGECEICKNIWVWSNRNPYVVYKNNVHTKRCYVWYAQNVGDITQDDKGRDYTLHHYTRDDNGDWSKTDDDCVEAITINEHRRIHAGEVCLRMLDEGTHQFQKYNPAKDRMEDGTHNFLTDEVKERRKRLEEFILDLTEPIKITHTLSKALGYDRPQNVRKSIDSIGYGHLVRKAGEKHNSPYFIYRMR
jgi:hypothetical protein